MTTRRGLLAVSLLVLASVLVALFLFLGSGGSRPTEADPAAPANAAQRHATPSARPSSRPPKAPDGPPLTSTSVLAPLFPGKADVACDRPEHVPAGRYRAGDADVLVRGDATTVWSGSTSGNGVVRSLGRWVGEIQWSEGACQWDVPDEVPITLQVKGGGVHTVAGCPIGEAIQTDADGRANVRVPFGQACTARTVLDDGRLGMGKRVAVVAEQPDTIMLQPATMALTDKEIAQGLRMLQMSTERQVSLAQQELDRVTDAGGSIAEAAWIIEAAQAHVEFMQGELDRLQNPATQLDAMADFLYGQSN